MARWARVVRQRARLGYDVGPASAGFAVTDLRNAAGAHATRVYGLGGGYQTWRPYSCNRSTMTWRIQRLPASPSKSWCQCSVTSTAGIATGSW